MPARGHSAPPGWPPVEEAAAAAAEAVEAEAAGMGPAKEDSARVVAAGERVEEVARLAPAGVGATVLAEAAGEMEEAAECRHNRLPRGRHPPPPT